jgi:hypothetical protein
MCSHLLHLPLHHLIYLLLLLLIHHLPHRVKDFTFEAHLLVSLNLVHQIVLSVPEMESILPEFQRFEDQQSLVLLYHDLRHDRLSLPFDEVEPEGFVNLLFPSNYVCLNQRSLEYLLVHLLRGLSHPVSEKLIPLLDYKVVMLFG